MRYLLGMAQRPAVRLLALVSVLAASGCSHTFFQFHINQVEQSEIMGARNALVQSAGDVNTLARVVDVNGRRAAETLVAGMTVEQTEADPQYQRLTRALYLGLLADGEDPISALDSEISMIAARVAQRVAVHGLNQFGLGGLAAMVGVVVPDDSGQRLREMQATLVRGQFGACTQLVPIISYDAAILGHIHSQLAENDPVYVDWRSRVRAIHLVRFACPTGSFLVVFTKNAGEAGVRAIGWHHVTPQQWQVLEPRLRHALDLN